MAGNKMKLVTGSLSLLLLLFLLLTSSKCNEDKDPEYVYMIFEIPIRINPGSAESYVGDTLWISGSFPDTLREYYSKKYYRFPDFNFKSGICLKELVKLEVYLSEQPGAFDKFSILNMLGSYHQISTNCGNLEFVYSNNSYNYKIGLIAKSSGVFTLFFLMPVDLHGFPEDQIDLKPIIDLGVTPDGRKRIPVYDAFFFTVNDGQTNFDLLTRYCRAGSIVNPSAFKIVHADQKGTFTFRVN
jgi:hypothetical protein